MTQYLSNKLTVLYTVLIVMVVYIHSSYIEANQYDIARFLQNLTGGGICRIANCLFFCISGYLFARNIHSVNDIWPKLLKRTRTLLLPYLLWNIIFVLWYVVIENLPGISAFSNTPVVEAYSSQSVGETLYSHPLKSPFLRDIVQKQYLANFLKHVPKSFHGSFEVIGRCCQKHVYSISHHTLIKVAAQSII